MCRSAFTTSGVALSQMLTLYARGSIDRQRTHPHAYKKAVGSTARSLTRDTLANALTDAQLRAGTGRAVVGSGDAVRAGRGPCSKRADTPHLSRDDPWHAHTNKCAQVHTCIDPHSELLRGRPAAAPQRGVLRGHQLCLTLHAKVCLWEA